jgi:hypothetical protein
MKVLSKLLMFTLVLSVFVGCKKDDENKDEKLPIEGVAGTYKGDIIVNIPTLGADTIDDVFIVITHSSGNNVSLSVSGAILGSASDITATCAVKSTKDSYSLSGSTNVPSVTIPGLEEILKPLVPAGTVIPSSISLNVTVKDNSTIDKAGNATINIDASNENFSAFVITIKFEGKKQNK